MWLTGANWYGFNLEQRMLVGLNVANHDELMDQIASRGINVIRVPISTELLLEWRDGEARVPQSVNASLNPDLAGKTTLEVFDAFLRDAKDRGVKVFLDVHSALADDDGHGGGNRDERHDQLPAFAQDPQIGLKCHRAMLTSPPGIGIR